MRATSLAIARALPTTEEIARRLDAWNRWRLLPGPGAAVDESDVIALRQLENGFIEAERSAVRVQAAAAPLDADGFVRWFEGLEASGPGQHDPLFVWLARDASLSDVTWFLRQEVAGEAGFEDLVALTQVKMPVRAKLELARNYWDEMGQGNASGMHGPMLGRLAEALGIAGTSPDEVVWESLALSNLMMALAMDRRYAYHALGALGVIELTAPARARSVNAGLKRLGVQGEARRYFALHATLDIKHSQSWNSEVLHPLVSAEPHVAAFIAEGALMRLNAGARCFARYRHALAVAG
jgi:hypothetical protein